MGLEVATYISQLDSANPLAGDRKSVGDDHLRLLKAVLKATFPNASRAVYIPAASIKTTTYSVVEADENKTILLDTSGGSFIVTLPTPSFDGFVVRLVKATADVNFVRVVPPSGTINGLAGIRVGVPYEEHVFIYNSTGGWFHLNGSGAHAAGTLLSHAGTTTPAGYGLANGQSLVRVDCPELFAAWGVTYGAVDGTHFNAPSVLDRFIVAAGSAYTLGATGGEATHVLTTAEMPVHTHGVTQNPHDHAIAGKEAANGNVSGAAPPTGGLIAAGGNPDLDVQPANADITIDNAGSGNAHENRPPYFALYPIFRLC